MQGVREPGPADRSTFVFPDRLKIMFDYAISQHQKHPPSTRLLGSWVVSCLCHAALVLILLEYPQLLRGGMNRWFRSPVDISSSTGAPRKDFRNLVVLSTKMEMPAPEELKKYLYSWEQAKAREAQRPPVHVTLPRSALDAIPPLPKSQQDEPATVPTAPVSLTGSAGAATPPPPVSAAGNTGNAVTAGQQQPQLTEPKQVPKGISTTPAAGSSAAAATPAKDTSTIPARPPAGGGTEEQQTGVRVQGNVLFDTKGVNLDEYARMVKQRIEERWLIPSNLRNYQGSVTVVFYITKEGQITGAKIERLSGNDSLDYSALSAVWEANPFPPLPRGFPAERVGARLVFAYNERQ
jgi:TonB family protein